MPPVDLPRSPVVTALEAEDNVYAVGGAVRDLLLGREPNHLDLVVEGDALEVARHIGGRVVPHERFGTATIELDGVTFDLASARRERYERPGALPEVELGATLREDLERRDFTVNAIAVRLKDGELIWLPGAQEDLEARRLRILHDRSFLDDPTRLLRLARFAARLGFEPDERTDRLAAEAVAGGAVGTVTGSRLGAELRLLLKEPQPAALQALERHGLGAALLDRFSVNPEIIERAIALTPPDARPDLAAFAAALGGERQAVAAMLDDLAFPAGERNVVAHAAAAPPLEPGNDAALWRRLQSAPAEAVAVAGARGDAGAARRWLDDVRHRRLAITGDDIVAAGLYGPAVGEALDRAMAAMLTGRADTREEQLAAALG